MNVTVIVFIRWQPWAEHFIYMPSLYSHKNPGERSYDLHLIEEEAAGRGVRTQTIQLRGAEKTGIESRGRAGSPGRCPSLVPAGFYSLCLGKTAKLSQELSQADVGSVRLCGGCFLPSPSAGGPSEAYGRRGMQCKPLSVPGGDAPVHLRPARRETWTLRSLSVSVSQGSATSITSVAAFPRGSPGTQSSV